MNPALMVLLMSIAGAAMFFVAGYLAKKLNTSVIKKDSLRVIELQGKLGEALAQVSQLNKENKSDDNASLIEKINNLNAKVSLATQKEAKDKETLLAITSKKEHLESAVLLVENSKKELLKKVLELNDKIAKLSKLSQPANESKVKPENKAVFAKLSKTEKILKDTQSQLEKSVAQVMKNKSQQEVYSNKIQNLQNELAIAAKKTAADKIAFEKTMAFEKTIASEKILAAEKSSSDDPEVNRLLAEIEHQGRLLLEAEKVKDENAELRIQVVDFKDKANLSDKLKKQVKDLNAKLFLQEESDLPNKNATKHDSNRNVDGNGGQETLYTSLDEALEQLVNMNQVRAAVVADEQGLLVAGAGENKYFEGLAAITGRIEELGKLVNSELPFSKLNLVHLQDDNDAIIACSFFERDGQLLVVCTIGANMPPGKVAMELTVAAIEQ